MFGLFCIHTLIQKHVLQIPNWATVRANHQ